MTVQSTIVAEAPLFETEIARVRAGFAEGRTRSYAWRRDQLKALIRMLETEEAAILDALAKDMGRGATGAWISDVALPRKEAKFALKHLKTWMKPVRVGTPLLALPGQSRIQPEPLGVVLIMTAWNFPFHEAFTPLVGAIAAGNAAVIKPSELCVHSAALMADLVARYLDPACFAVVQGGVAETTALLKYKFDHICFTGSGAVGRIVSAAAAKHLTPVTLELGGKCPVVVDKSADLAVTARRIAWGKWQNCGQMCIAPDYAIVHEDVREEFLAALKAEVVRAFGEDPSQSADYDRIINQRHFDRLTGYLTDAEVLFGGQHDRDSRYIAPTILDGSDLASPVMREEIFGPILPVIGYRDDAEVVDHVTARDKPLAFYLFTRDRRQQAGMTEAISAGMVCINDVVMFVAALELPFGGVGASGTGAYGGVHGFETFSHMKPVMTRSRHLDITARYAPFTKAKRKLLRIAWH